MTPEDYRKYLQDTQPQGAASFPPQIRAPDPTDDEASGPANEPARMVTPAPATRVDQATLLDKYGTGFINFGQYGQGSSDTQQFQPIPASSGSLYDPLAPVPPPPPLAQLAPQHAPLPPAEAPDVDFGPASGGGPIMKPRFQRTRNALGYRGGEY